MRGPLCNIMTGLRCVGTTRHLLAQGGIQQERERALLRLSTENL